MDFREYTVERDGKEIIIKGTITEPVRWDFSIRMCEDDLPGISRVALKKATLGFLLRSMFKRKKDNHWSVPKEDKAEDEKAEAAKATRQEKLAAAKAARAEAKKKADAATAPESSDKGDRGASKPAADVRPPAASSNGTAGAAKSSSGPATGAGTTGKSVSFAKPGTRAPARTSEDADQTENTVAANSMEGNAS